MWFFYAFLCVLFWGFADLFYKKGADETKSFTHIKTAIMVGLVMGIHAFFLLLTQNLNFNPINLIIYLPVSAMYILSMILGYFGLRYLELSISSPVQNSSGAIACILCVLFLGQTLDFLSSIAVFSICLGIFLLGVFEKHTNKVLSKNKKYTIGFVAFLIPIFYCILDAGGTFFDAFYLDDISTTPLIGATEATLENVACVSYELTFFIVAVLLFIFLRLFKKEKFELLTLRNTGIAAIFETIGQSLYVFAMSGNAVVAAPMVSSYAIISLVLSRIFLREKLNKKQYFAICLVLLGIILLGISEGLAE